MKKFLLLVTLFALFFNSYAQNDSIRKPIECGTDRIMQLENERNQKIIEDFIAASKKDTMFGNGLWGTIGKQNTDEDILKEGLKGYDWRNDHILILKSLDDKNHHYILFSHQKDGQKAYQAIAMYHKKSYSFRTYDAFWYKNYQHPELNGEWMMSKEFSPKGNSEIILNRLEHDYDFGYFLKIKEDYTFETFMKGDCPPFSSIIGRYSFDADGKITFYCNEINFFSKKEIGKPFISGPFTFTKEDDSLIFKK